MMTIGEDDLARQTMYQLCLQQSSFSAIIQNLKNPSASMLPKRVIPATLCCTSALHYYSNNNRYSLSDQLNAGQSTPGGGRLIYFLVTTKV